ncbi:MAG: hypothetical protein DMF76_11030 [Acidobacteria bacterium]|nr:MAG: hypothetical protein DMF76_11030 [Acidobacteriota bacterium]
MLGQRLPQSLLGALMLAGAILGLACGKSADETKSPELEPRAVSSNSPSPGTPPIPRATATPIEANQSPGPPPKPDEVRDAMARVFNKAVALDEHQVPGFFVGDFNGDGSEDLAVATRPSENSIPEINNELANWTLEDPRSVPIPGTKAAEQGLPPKPVRAEKSDSLLAIIHGIGKQGWRNHEARQTFLLRNGAGSNMVVQSLKNLRSGAGNAHLPPLRGDAISQTLGGRSGILFWTGAKYAWYSPEK